MKVGIIGPAHMARTWEQHLRAVSHVQEVVIARSIDLLNDIDACLILNEAHLTASSSNQLLDALKCGYHVLWVAPLPTDSREIKNWHEASEEAGVVVMFSMWAHYSPATRWLFNHISTPQKIHIHREWPGPRHTPDASTLYRILLEEISLCLEWTRSQPVKVEGDLNFAVSHHDEMPAMRQLHIQFSNGTSASIHVNPFGLESRHSRFVTGDKMAAVCQVNEHLIKKWLLHDTTSHTPELMHFDYREPAYHLLSHFMRSVQTGEQPIFGISELNELVSLVNRFRSS